MRHDEFEALLNRRIGQIKSVLGQKAKEYALDDDRLYNFKAAARIANITPTEALRCMTLKHLVSVSDLIEGKLLPTQALVDEKVGDVINYLILLEALLQENQNVNIEAPDAR